MTSENVVSIAAPDEPFTIHLLNTYENILLRLFAEEFGLGAPAVYRMAREMHHLVEDELKTVGIEYSTLRNALTPQRGRHEVAYVFDSHQAGGMYGYAVSKSWLPALRKHGPKKTAIKHGDMIGLRPEVAWAALEKYLVGPKDFPRMSSEMYYIVYLSNLSSGQMKQMHEALSASSEPYLGYVDCSTWNPLKSSMPLPQYGLRVEDVIISAERDGYANELGFPVENYGFEILGIEETLYDTLLTFRLDQGVPQWASEDASMSLGLLGGKQTSFEEIKVRVDTSRIKYLKEHHAEAFQAAGLHDLQPDAVANVIKDKIRNGLIYNLRFVEGSREGVLVPELNAHMFTVQAEFPDVDGHVRRYQIGMKYTSAAHTCELVTFI